METNTDNIAPEFKEYVDSKIIQIIDETIQKIREILDRTLEEEEKADKHLSSIAQDVNDEALELSRGEEEMA